MKFKKGDRVKKSKGYAFTGIVVSAYKVDGGERYDVQVVGKLAVEALRKMIHKGDIELKDHLAGIYMEELLMNCDGMIHIFSDKQLENYD